MSILSIAWYVSTSKEECSEIIQKAINNQYVKGCQGSSFPPTPYQSLSGYKIHSLLDLIITVRNCTITNTLYASLCSHSVINCLKLDMFSCCSIHCRWTHVLAVDTRGIEHKSAHSQPVAASTCDQ